MSDISERLLSVILEKDYSYGELSKITGIPKSAIQRYATGETGKIPIDRLEALAAALGVSSEYLMGWEENPILKQQHEEMDAILDKMPPELRTRAIDLLKELAQMSQSPDDRKESV